MFIVHNNETAYFRSLSGKVFPAHRFRLYFKDEKLEKEYLQYMLKQSIPIAKIITGIVPIWTACLLILFKVTDFWGAQPLFTYLIPVIGIPWCPISFFLISKFQNTAYFSYIEYLYFVSQIVYVDWMIIFLSAYMSFYQDQVQFIEWIATLCLAFSVTFRRRLPLTMLNVIISILFDIVVEFGLMKVTVIVSQHMAVLATVLITAFIYVYQTEIIQRSSFLNEKETESWKIETKDIKLEQLIGTGTYGEVYRGQWRGFSVAIKKIIPKVQEVIKKEEKKIEEKEKYFWMQWRFYQIMKRRMQERREKLEAQQKIAIAFEEFEKEIRVICALKHPNIVSFMGACLQKPNMLLVLECCSLGSLFDLLVNPHYKPLSLLMKIEFALGSSLGLYYLHSQNPPILHRDFKSLNILVDHQWTVKVCDFGLCDFANELQKTTKKKEEKDSQDIDNVIGTIPWIAPEIFSKQPYSEKSDIFSLAIVFWEIFAEKHPYQDELESGKVTIKQLVQAVTTKDYRPRVSKYLRTIHNGQKYQKKTTNEMLLPIPETMLEIMKLCWHRDPKKRLGWSEILESLSQVKAELKRMTFSDEIGDGKTNISQVSMSIASTSDQSRNSVQSTLKRRPKDVYSSVSGKNIPEDKVEMPNVFKSVKKEVIQNRQINFDGSDKSLDRTAAVTTSLNASKTKEHFQQLIHSLRNDANLNPIRDLSIDKSIESKEEPINIFKEEELVLGEPVESIHSSATHSRKSPLPRKHHRPDTPAIEKSNPFDEYGDNDEEAIQKEKLKPLNKIYHSSRILKTLQQDDIN